MTGDDAIARILKIEGVEWLAAFPNQRLIDAAARQRIRPLITRTERTGVNMADGFSRVMNRRAFGVFTMQMGPGAENAFAGAAQAYADSIPLLLLPGGVVRDRTQIHPGFDAVLNYRGVTKWAANVNDVGRIPELLRVAFHRLRHGRPGPVLLEIPGDVGRAECPEPHYEPPRAFRSAADGDDVRDLVTAMDRAARPLICAGHGVLWAEASQELTALAERTGIPVMTTMAGKSAFPEDHELALGTGGHTGTGTVAHFLQRADFVLGVGTSFTRSIFGAPMPEAAVLAQVTDCAEDLNKDYAVHHGAIGDARLALRQIAEEVERQGSRWAPQADEVGTARRAFEARWQAKLRSEEVPINPYRVLTELVKAVDVGTTIATHDSGYPRDQFLPFWPACGPRSYLGWGKSTQLGYGLGLALGAKLAAPDRQVINVMGDAAIGMAGMDIETAVREQIPILTVVLNNGVMTHYDENLPVASRDFGTNRLGGNYSGVARELGAHAQRVERPGDLGAAIARAVEANREGRPALIEAMTKVEEAVPTFW